MTCPCPWDMVLAQYASFVSRYTTTLWLQSGSHKNAILSELSCLQKLRARAISILLFVIMMTSSNGSIFHITGPLWGESTGQGWIPLTKASDAELWCFLRWTSGWANNGDAGDLRRNHTHYEVSVMYQCDKEICSWIRMGPGSFHYRCIFILVGLPLQNAISYRHIFYDEVSF